MGAIANMFFDYLICRFVVHDWVNEEDLQYCNECCKYRLNPNRARKKQLELLAERQPA